MQKRQGREDMVLQPDIKKGHIPEDNRDERDLLHVIDIVWEGETE